MDPNLRREALRRECLLLCVFRVFLREIQEALFVLTAIASFPSIPYPKPQIAQDLVYFNMPPTGLPPRPLNEGLDDFIV